MSRDSLLITQTTTLWIPVELIKEAHLSVPAWRELAGSNGFCRDIRRARTDPKAPRNAQGILRIPVEFRSYDAKCLKSYPFHLEFCGLRPEDKWILIGVRNLGNNLGVVGYHIKKTPVLLQLNGEGADRPFPIVNLTKYRPYYCLCWTKEKITIEKVEFHQEVEFHCQGLIRHFVEKIRLIILSSPQTNPEEIIWAVSGVPLVWEGRPVSLDEIIYYEYDLSHIWRVPKNPKQKTSPLADGAGIQQLTEAWMTQWVTDPFLQSPMSCPIPRKIAEQKGYRREKSYLHSAIGISKDGKQLIWLMAYGAYENISEMLISAGAWRAIGLDQGGSCCLMSGGDPEFFPGRVISASHYFRPKALSVIILELKKMKIIGKGRQVKIKSLSPSHQSSGDYPR